MHGINPGPLIFDKSGVYVYGIYFVLIIASVFMLIFERAGMRIFAKVLDIPKHILLSTIMIMCCVGAYSSNSRVFDVQCVLFFELLGLMFKCFKIPSTPLIIGFILGSMFEENMRMELYASHGSWMIFIERPISLAFLVIAVVFCTYTVITNLRGRDKAEAEGKEYHEAEEGEL